MEFLPNLPLVKIELNQHSVNVSSREYEPGQEKSGKKTKFQKMQHKDVLEAHLKQIAENRLNSSRVQVKKMEQDKALL